MRPSPEAFPRRILAAVCGLSPQILTETLYALAVQADPAFVPTEIHLLTTREGAHRASLTLLHPETGQFHRLRRDYGLPEIAFDAEHIHVVRGADGAGLDDIRSPADNERLADSITQAIREYTQDPEAALHVSMAGGRKTMGYYAGYALSLFGRPQDRLSHVLVTPDYEGNPDFYYPTPASRIIYTRENRPLDTSKAEVSLAEIPFIRLREDIPARLLNGKAGFGETIDAARRADEPPHLIVDREARELRCNGVSIHLPDIQFTFYLWVVERVVISGHQLSKPEGHDRYLYAAEFQKLYEEIISEWRDTEKVDEGMRDGMKPNFVEEKISRINTTLKDELGGRLAQHYLIVNRGRRKQSDYRLDLSSSQVEII